ncbi:hypothetical protein L3Q82_006705 [Scortum barcoo]|uniref:Uncharacterized protein n=1 Tax=Scortum barcoo TaxID=214431 RepID=A0ACB8WXM6_9TELE|nr:hypothetical protein L3Q82_006705 [Scortum barcoo]
MPEGLKSSLRRAAAAALGRHQRVPGFAFTAAVGLPKGSAFVFGAPSATGGSGLHLLRLLAVAMVAGHHSVHVFIVVAGFSSYHEKHVGCVMNERRKHQAESGADESMHVHGEQRRNFPSKAFHESTPFALLPPRPQSYTRLSSRGFELLGLQETPTTPCIRERPARHEQPGAAKVSELHLYLPSSLCDDEEQDAEAEEMSGSKDCLSCERTSAEGTGTQESEAKPNNPDPLMSLSPSHTDQEQPNTALRMTSQEQLTCEVQRTAEQMTD